jgi:predicted outer membrane repeat protein
VTVRSAKRVTVIECEVSEGGQMLVESGLVEITGNKFHQMKDDKGGAVYLQGGIGQITSNSFTSNYATKGGAIYFDSPANISLNQNNFTNNTAFSSTKGSGGAILYNCPSLNCSLYLDSSNKFINNSASHDGGAILWEHTPLFITKAAFYKNNIAPYAPDLGSFPVKLSIAEAS